MKSSMSALALVLPLLALHPSSSEAAPPDAHLSAAEALDACAVALPEQLACKEDFCSAMVDLRRAHQPRFASVDRAEMVQGCLKEIAVDGTGDLKTRRGRCEAWSKGRPSPPMLRSDAAAAQACFAKANCQERIACWAPIAEKRFTAAKH